MEIPGYKIERLIGHGGMGSVYRAVQLDLDRVVALKVIHPHLADDPDFRARFKSEMKLATKLDHPHVVPVYDAGEVDGLAFISMAYIPGSDLARKIATDGPLSRDNAVSVVTEIGSALSFAHEHKIIHRDVKPSNILVHDRIDHAYLSDFGIAKSLEETHTFTRSGFGIGALRYIAPEQIEGDRVDARADIYSLACVLVEALTGKLPFKDGSVGFMISERLKGEPELPSQLDADMGTEFDAVVGKALARNPDDRFDSVDDFIRAVQSAVQGDSATTVVRQPKSELDKTSPLPRGDEDATTAIDRGARALFRRQRAVVLIAGAIVALCLGGLAVAQLGDFSNKGVEGDANIAKASTSTKSQEATTSKSEAVEVEPLEFEKVERRLFTANLPSDWTPDDVDKRNNGRFTNDWHSPTQSETTVLIDSQRPSPAGSVMDSAAPVRAQTRKSEGYSEVSFKEVSLGGRPAAEWIFDLPGERKVDYFFQECGIGFAVLGKAPPSEFDSMKPIFRKVASSVEPACEPLSESSPISTQGVGPILVGMTVDEVKAAGRIELEVGGDPTSDCHYGNTDDVDGVYFMFTKGVLSRVDVDNPAFSTLSGVRVGDLESDVFEAYGDQITSEPDYYYPEKASHLTYTPDDPSDHTRVVFDVVDGVVTNIRAGWEPEVHYIEGCF